MDEVSKSTVRRAIEAMHENLAEPLTVDDMARTAMFSRFHFTRVFKRITGTSPGRFRTAMRLARAKQLLVATSKSVTEISHEVGYSSVGTFSARFSSGVGVSPRTYRRLGGVAPDLTTVGVEAAAGQPPATVEGLVSDHGKTGNVFVGVFPDPVPEGRPVSCAVLSAPGPYTLDNVAPGTWFVLAHRAPPPAAGSPPGVAEGTARSVGAHGPIVVRPDTVVRANLRLHPMSAFDPPPVLAALDSPSLAALARA
jgi:AraC-like DNA-binding protein